MGVNKQYLPRSPGLKRLPEGSEMGGDKRPIGAI